jgi:hypothetical protein
LVYNRAKKINQKQRREKIKRLEPETFIGNQFFMHFSFVLRIIGRCLPFFTAVGNCETTSFVIISQHIHSLSAIIDLKEKIAAFNRSRQLKRESAKYFLLIVDLSRS